MTFDDNTRINGFHTWDELWPLLKDNWMRVDDDQQQLRLKREGDELLVVANHRRLRARERRHLQRMGFRPFNSAGVVVWHWHLQDALQRMNLEDFCKPFEKVFNVLAVAAHPDEIEQLRTGLARAHLMREQTQRVVRGVFRSRLGDVSVTLRRADEWWEDDGADESLQQPPARRSAPQS